MKILIVDDMAENVFLLEALLEGKGYEVASARNGKEALARLKEGPFDLIVSDIMMPVMDGFQLCRECKTNPAGRQIPFVIYTATYTEKKDEEFALALGADRFVVKPQEPEKFLEIIKEVLNPPKHEIKINKEPAAMDEKSYLAAHSERVIRKLEKRTVELARAHDALQISERKYRDLFERMIDVYYQTDAEGVLTVVSPSVKDVWGYQPEEVIGKKLGDYYVNPEERRRFLAQVTQTGEVREFEAPLRAKDGAAVIVSTNARLRRDEQGNILGVEGISRDVTSRRRAEDALAKSEERFRKAFYTSPDSVNINRLSDGMYVSINPGFTRITGYTEEEIVGISSIELNIWHNAEDRQRLVEGLRRDGQVTNLEVVFRMKSGELRDGLMSAAIIDLDGTPHILSITRDVTELKRSQEALRKSEQKYRWVVDNMADVITVLDMDLRITYVSPSILRLRGLTAEEAMAQTLDQIMTPESMQVIVGVFEDEMKLEASGTADPFRSRVLELQEYRKDGTIVWIENTLSYIRDENLKPLGIISASRDITERKEVDTRLQQTLETLRKAMDAIIQALASAVEMRDPYTAGHQRRVADLACAVAEEMGLSADRIEGIRVAAVIHDVGKIAVPAEILSKPKKLTEIEFSLIRVHSTVGYDILKDIDFPWPIARMVLEHHERLDGSGYPNGRRAEDILMESRILTVADVVEAMASHRPYRPSLGIDAALEELAAKKGIHYDDEVVAACQTLFRDRGYTLKL